MLVVHKRKIINNYVSTLLIDCPCIKSVAVDVYKLTLKKNLLEFMNKEKNRKPLKAFTMIEAIVVAVIVGILAAIAIPVLSGYLRGARLDAGRSSIEMVGAAIMQTHNRGIDIGTDDWPSLGITDPSDDTWKFTFGSLNANAPDATVQAYALTATCKKGSLKGQSGTYSPNLPHGSRWTLIFDGYDQ